MADAPKIGWTKVKRRLLPAVKVAIAALVIWGIWGTVRNAHGEMARHALSLAELRPAWLLASVGFYALGLLSTGLFWLATLRALGQRPKLGATLRAYFVGHLGKYVPGKAMVVVLRAGLVRGPRVDVTVAAVSVFVETLTMLAVGAFLAAVTIALHFRGHRRLLLLAVVLMLGAGLPTIPPVFRYLVRRMKLARVNPDVDSLLAGLTFRLIAAGWAANLLGWFLLAASLWAVLKALPLETPAGGLLELLPLVLAATTLAMVAGFISLLPGGVGVREWIISSLMAPRIGAMGAIVSAVMVRLVWLTTELASAGALSILAHQRAPRRGKPGHERPRGPG